MSATQGHGVRRGSTSLLAAGVTGILAVGLAVPLAGAAPSGSRAASGAGQATVVLAKKRPGFGRILVTNTGRALYKDTADGPNHPTCTGRCASIWPPLLMPQGKTIPEGVTGLGTVKVAHQRLQVTFHKMPLYTFISDSGKSVTGNGVAGFEVVPDKKG